MHLATPQTPQCPQAWHLMATTTTLRQGPLLARYPPLCRTIRYMRVQIATRVRAERQNRPFPKPARIEM
eukprot:6182703-Pleurochrysis_carterae.AAC.1